MRTGNIMIGAIGVPHYTKDGRLYTDEMHKDASGRLMTGKTHNANSQFLFHNRNGIGAVKQSFYTTKELLRDIKQMDPSVKNLSKVKIRKSDKGNLIVYNGGNTMFVLPKNYLSASTIARYSK